MAKLNIQPHGRLNDWVAHDKGYFRAERLDYEINVEGSRKNTPELPEIRSSAPVRDTLFGAFERYEEGDGRKGEGAGDVSCACHWTVNQAAKLEKGVMWGKAYSVCEAAIVVPAESSVREPRDLAGQPVAVGYHSGSHYSALQSLEVFLPPGKIELKFVGSSWSRVDAALARKIPAVNVWGPQLYLLEQHGFRRIVSTTFMMAFMFPRDVDSDSVESYMRALIRAQMDIDLEPEKYKHYFINEIPERFRESIAERHAIEVEVAESARQAVHGVDIVSCCTSTNEPIFFNDWLEPGMHVTNLTSSETQADLPGIVDVVARAGEATPRLERLSDQVGYHRAGFLGYVAGQPEERALVPRLELPPEIIDMPRLVDIIAGTHGRTRDDQTSFFLNVGAIGVQFEAVAAAVYERALEEGLGRDIPTDCFLQDVRD